MKFRVRMILAYSTIAVLVSLVLGLLMYRSGDRYERNTQRNSLEVSARSYVTQMDDRLGRMDAILYYILSDPSMLESMTLLGRASDGNIPGNFLMQAKNTMEVGVSTEYIMRNSYRTVYFNEDGFFASSAVRQSGYDALNQRLIEDYALEEVDYLDPVIEGDGHSVIVGPHTDFWGAYGSVQVYSMMKAPRGNHLGFLEVENRIDSLKSLASSDPDIRFAILVNDNELLYASDPGMDAAGIAGSMQPGEILSRGGSEFAKAVSDRYALTVITGKPQSLMAGGRSRVFLTSFLAALFTFGICLVSIIIWSSILTRPVRRLQSIVENTSIDNLKDEERSREMGQLGRTNDEFAGLVEAYQAMTSRLDQALQNEKRSAMLQLQAQFDTLQTQVNPHFIYNVLNVISSRAVMDDDEVICEMCGCLGNMLRYSTNNIDRYARVEEELQYLDSYFYLLKSRYEDRLTVRTDMDETVKKQIIPKMTLQQIVENSVKHGFHETGVKMEISLSGRSLEKGWLITVRDNGVGITPERLAEIRERLGTVQASFLDREVPTEAQIGGIGLTNTYARCLLLFGDSLIFEIGNAEDGSGFETKIGRRDL